MSPERIRGDVYSFDSDLWSLGLTLLEGALGCFPYSFSSGPQSQQGLGFWDLLDTIVEGPAPVPSALSTGSSPEFCGFVEQCLQKDPALRPTAAQLLNHPWIKREPLVSPAAARACGGLDAPSFPLPCLQSSRSSRPTLRISSPRRSAPPPSASNRPRPPLREHRERRPHHRTRDEAGALPSLLLRCLGTPPSR